MYRPWGDCWLGSIWRQRHTVIINMAPIVGCNVLVFFYRLLVAISLSLACLVVEVFGLVTGLSMFSPTTNLFCIQRTVH